MAEINIDGGPIFVDVSSNQHFPILYGHLLNNQDGNQTTPSLVKNEDKRQDTQTTAAVTESDTTTPETDPCIKIEHRRIRCPECKRYTAETEEKMLRHIRKVHRGENPFQCYMCDYSTYNKAVFEEHVRVHQGIKPFKCSVCDYKSASKKNAKKHELIHRPDNPRKCPDCDFVARHPKALSSHRRKLHGDGGSSKSKVCGLCNTKIKDSKFRSHSKNRKRCEYCLATLCNRKLLSAHLKEVHDKTLDVTKKPLVMIFNCAICKWSSNSKPRILLHLIHHPNQTVDEDAVDISILRNLGIME